MKRKLIGLFSTLLLIGGALTPSVSAVTAIDDTQAPQEQTTSTQDIGTSHSSDGISLGDTMSEMSQTSTNEEEMATQESSTTEENVEKIKIDDINFPDEHFRNLLLQIIDSDGDGYLGNELKQTTELDLKDAKIESLEGIQNFKNLKKLEVQDNELQEVDLQQLKELNYLDISNNQLSKIDLSKNEKLNYFKGSDQRIMAFAENADNGWQITNDKLQPEPDRIVIDSSQWQYDGTTFRSSVQVSLNYTYQIVFSSQVELEQTSDVYLSVNVSVDFEQPHLVTTESIEPKEGVINLHVGESQQLEYSIVPEHSEIATPIWMSADDQIAEVDQNGQVTAVKLGSTDVTFSDGENKLGVFKVVVSENEATNTDAKEKIETKKTDENRLLTRSTTSPIVRYQTHVQDIGWQEEKVDGATSGTTGQKKRIEAIKINVSDPNLNGSVEYSSHIQDIGWQNYVKAGASSGTTGQSLRLESVRIKLTGQLSQYFDIYYRTHTAEFGWLGWTKNGGEAGTSGFSYRMEAIQIKIVEKTQQGPTLGKAFWDKKTLTIPNVNYQVYSEGTGWQPLSSNGAIAGTTGQKMKIVGVRINVTDSLLQGGIQYSSHIQDIGWQGYVGNNDVSGITNTNKRIESIKIQLTGELNQFFDVYYRVHSAEFGWLGWAKNGNNSGTSGFSFRMEALQVQLVVKGQKGPTLATSYYEKSSLALPTVNYQAHSQSIGWQGTRSNGTTAGTTGQKLRMEAIKLNISNSPVNGEIEYSTHVQNNGWQNYVKTGHISGTTGEKLSIEAIKVRLKGTLSALYDVYYRVHTSNIGWLDWAKNDQFAGTTGLSYPMEAIQVVLVKKGAAAPGKTDTPYQTSINHLFVMGHGVNDPGASYAGVNERDFTRKELMPYLQKWASRLSKNKITFYNTNADMYQDSQKLQGAYTVSDSFSSVSEFHLDAGAINLSTGGHVIAHRNGNSLTSQNYAIANVIRNYVGLWGSVQNTGGINLRADLLNMNVLQSRGIPYRLAELGFITNSRDVANIRNNIDSMTKGIVESVTGEKL